jgi:hypothetical protein
MPFRSEKQRKFLWIHHPEIAKRWVAEHGSRIQPKKKNTIRQKPKRHRED